MKAEDLRKGNIVLYNGEIVNGINTIEIYHFDIGKIKLEPITLTEEWLLKFGFSKNPIGIYEKYNSKLHKTFVVPFDTDHEVRLSMPYGNGIMTVAKDITSVHHLQNLYYFSTFQELEVKP